jgi:hypothetical protein
MYKQDGQVVRHLLLPAQFAQVGLNLLAIEPGSRHIYRAVQKTSLFNEIDDLVESPAELHQD